MSGGIFFYALGKLGSKYPLSSRDYLPDLISRLDDDNRICRVMAVRALGLIASQRPKLVEESFQNSKREIPSLFPKYSTDPDAGLRKLIPTIILRYPVPDRFYSGIITSYFGCCGGCVP